MLAGFARWIDAQLVVCVRSPARASRSARLQRARTTAPAGLKRLTSPTKEPEPSSGAHLADAPAAANLPCALDDGRLQRKSSAWSPYPLEAVMVEVNRRLYLQVDDATPLPDFLRRPGRFGAAAGKR